MSEERLRFEPQLDVFTLNYSSSTEAQIVRQRWQNLLPSTYLINYDNFLAFVVKGANTHMQRVVVMFMCPSILVIKI